MKNWNEMTVDEKINAYEESYILEYRFYVEHYKQLLIQAKENLTIAEQEKASGKTVTSPFARKWGLKPL